MSELTHKEHKEYKILVTDADNSSSMNFNSDRKSLGEAKSMMKGIKKANSYEIIKKQLEILKSKINHIENEVTSQSIAIERINQGSLYDLINRILRKIKALNK